MPDTQTYDIIEAKSLSTSATSVTFSNVPQTYTDLFLVVTGKAISGGVFDLNLQFNTDTATSSTNYGRMRILGNGSSLTSDKSGPDWRARVGLANGAALFANKYEIFSYTNTNVWKRIFAYSGAPESYVKAATGVWKSTAAITSVIIQADTALATGTTACLYGIKAAS